MNEYGNHSLGYGQPRSSHRHREKWLSFVSQQLPITSILGMGLHRHPRPRSKYARMLIGIILCRSCASNYSFWVDLNISHVKARKKLFPSSPFHPLRLPFFLFILQWSFLSLGYREVDIDDPSVVVLLQSFIMSILTKLWGLEPSTTKVVFLTKDKNSTNLWI